MVPEVSDAVVDFARAVLARYVTYVEARGRMTGRSAFGVSASEVVALLDARAPVAHPQHDGVLAARAALASALAAAPEGALGRLSRRYSFDTTDLEIVALLLAPELDRDLERVVAFALDDFTRKRPDAMFVARALGLEARDAVDGVLDHLDDNSTLVRDGVVVLASADLELPGTARTVRIADRIVAFLRGRDVLDELVADFVRVGAAVVSSEQLVMDGALVQRIGRALEGRRGPARVLLAGPDGAGRALAVEAVLARSGGGSVRIDLAGMLAGDRFEARLRTALREAVLRDRVAILEGGPRMPRELAPDLTTAIARAARTARVPVVFTLPDHPAWLVDGVADLIALDVPAPTLRQRQELWQRALPPPLAAAEALETVASRYAFTGGTITRVAARAAAAARLREPAAPTVTLEDLGTSARHAFSRSLGALAQRVRTGFSWDDLVLPPDTLEALREIVRFAHLRAFLLEDWGFAAKLPYGRGVSAILAGPPGTGKTMVAQLLANEIGYDLYRIDLSQVVNKYVGETEKNLAKIFDEAESAHAVLFFDEADSLFARRTEVKSSNDRYANLEVNYLLQRMESFDGVTLLATNLEHGLDEAFKRRVRFTVQFELPEEAERRTLWRSMFPPRVPLAADIDWDVVARKFEMAGGYIKKAALRAALLAASARREVSTADLLEAAQLEYREMGRIS